MMLIYEFTSLTALLFIFINSLFLILWIHAWFLWFTFFAYKKINLYLCKANEEGRFCGFSKCTWEAGAFFSSAPRSQFSLGRLAQGQYRDNIKAGSIKFHFLEWPRLPVTIQRRLILLRLPQSPMRKPAFRPFLKTTAPHPIHIIYIAAAHFLRIRSKLHIAYILQNVNA